MENLKITRPPKSDSHHWDALVVARVYDSLGLKLLFQLMLLEQYIKCTFLGGTTSVSQPCSSLTLSPLNSVHFHLSCSIFLDGVSVLSNW